MGFWDVYEKGCGELCDLLPERLKWIGQWLWEIMPDNCQVCRGERGGVRGNENRLDNLVVCDYCTADMLREREKLKL